MNATTPSRPATKFSGPQSWRRFSHSAQPPPLPVGKEERE
ncbi:hypothetical protein I552_1843 [Mycobacterium xenopi 3993]|nr:hypothetical protein I552_1843 [Mycobacterium xenopi 3993]